MRELSGRVAVVTGAASGIGRGIVLAAARAGMQTVAADVDEAGIADVAREVEALGASCVAVPTDVTDEAAVEALAEKTWSAYGACHVLCNNAGVAVARPLHETSAEDWRWTLRVNLWGVINGVAAFLPRLVVQDAPSHIVNTASMAGLLPTPLLGAYTTSKFAVVGYSQSLRIELAERPVGISVLCPGSVATRIAEAGRNRPVALGPDVPIPEPIRAAIARGLDAEAAGRIVLDAIEAEEFWIFTHPEMKEEVLRGQASVNAAFDRWTERLA